MKLTLEQKLAPDRAIRNDGSTESVYDKLTEYHAFVILLMFPKFMFI